MERDEDGKPIRIVFKERLAGGLQTSRQLIAAATESPPVTRNETVVSVDVETAVEAPPGVVGDELVAKAAAKRREEGKTKVIITVDRHASGAMRGAGRETKYVITCDAKECIGREVAERAAREGAAAALEELPGGTEVTIIETDYQIHGCFWKPGIDIGPFGATEAVGAQAQVYDTGRQRTTRTTAAKLARQLQA
ncbi:MAG: hypothetical protein HYV63_21290 [Candidatus Schekmanbacteria bacterium]|nr:hypothetical protein [Candidatus Schekmanbacteria bacterium]